MSIYVIEPLQSAWRHMLRMCFQPFDPGKWLVVGFAAWLAYLGTAGPHILLPALDRASSCPAPNAAFFPPPLWPMPHFPPASHYYWPTSPAEWVGWLLFLSVVAMGLALGLLIALLFTWLRARMRLVFLDNVLHNRPAIVEPWHRTRRQGNSLFLFYLIATLVSLPFVLSLAIGFFRLSGVDLWYYPPAPWRVLLSVLPLAGLEILWVFLLFLVLTLTEHFVLPIMHHEQTTIFPAWEIFLGRILFPNFLSILLYYLLGILIRVLIALAYLLTCCLTCCAFGCISLIPYIGTVLLLPVYVLYRAWSLYLVECFNPNWRVPTPAAEAPAASPASPAI